MIRRPPRSTRTDPLFPYTTLFRSLLAELLERHHALPAEQRIGEIDAVFGADAATVAKTLDRLYADTALDDEAERLRLLSAAPAEVKASPDPLMQAAPRLLPAALREEDADKQLAGELLRRRPAYPQRRIGQCHLPGRP